jgi:ACS family tartrate transporter-like MFS transporter
MQGPLWSIPGTFLQGKSAAAGIAAMNMIGMVGGFLGPYSMGLAKTYTGTYQPGILALTIPSLAGALIILAMRRAHPTNHTR